MAESLRKLPISCLLLFLVAVGTAAYKVPAFDLQDPAVPKITQAPSVEALDLRLRHELAPRTFQSCATPCLDSAITKSTTCSLGDSACECQSLNAEIIYIAAYTCVTNACGYLVAASE